MMSSDSEGYDERECVRDAHLETEQVSDAPKTLMLATLFRDAQKRLGLNMSTFTRRTGYSYTFVRAIMMGDRFPGDLALEKMCARLDIDFTQALLARYCDRSPALYELLRARGIVNDFREGAL